MHTSAKAANGGQGIRPKRRRTKAILKEGLEAARRANLEMLEKCKPKTGLGGIIRGMVVEAAKAKTTPLRQVMALLEWRIMKTRANLSMRRIGTGAPRASGKPCRKKSPSATNRWRTRKARRRRSSGGASTG